MRTHLNLNLRNIWLFCLMAFAVAFSPKAYADSEQDKSYASFTRLTAQKVEWMQKNLDLTSAQLREIKAIEKDVISEVNGLKAAKSMDQKTRLNQLNMLNNNFNTKVKSVLTADQADKYETHLLEMRNKAMEKMDSY